MSEKAVILATVIGVLLLTALLLVSIAGILFLYQKRMTAIMRELEDVKMKAEQELLRVQLEVQEQTITQISRDLHDNIGHSITLAKLYINAIPTEHGTWLAAQTDMTVNLLTRTMDDLRDVCRNLTMNEIKDEGLVKAIGTQLDHLRKTEKYDITFNIQGDYNFLVEEKEIILFRIFQEAINNIIRHAGAHKISILLNYQPPILHFEIKDDGIGFAYRQKHSSDGHDQTGRGLKNMQSRAYLLNAEFRIESIEAEGTTILLTVPITEDSNYAGNGKTN